MGAFNDDSGQELNIKINDYVVLGRETGSEVK